MPPLLQIQSKSPGGGGPDDKAGPRASAAGRAKEGVCERGTVKAAAEAVEAGVWAAAEGASGPNRTPRCGAEARRSQQSAVWLPAVIELTILPVESRAVKGVYLSLHRR